MSSQLRWVKFKSFQWPARPPTAALTFSLTTLHLPRTLGSTVEFLLFLQQPTHSPQVVSVCCFSEEDNHDYFLTFFKSLPQCHLTGRALRIALHKIVPSFTPSPLSLILLAMYHLLASVSRLPFRKSGSMRARSLTCLPLSLLPRIVPGT